MKKFRVSSILVFSILLIIVAVGLLGTSVYFLLESKTAPAPVVLKPKNNSAVKQTTIVNNETSLAIVKPDTVSSLSSDTINSKLNEIYALKKEIPSVITSHTSDTDVTVTRDKISELLQKIDDLKSRTSKVESENKFLKTVLQQLTDELKVREQNIRRISKDSRTFTPAQNASVTISDVRLAAVSNEQETNVAVNADKIKGSFLLKNNSDDASFYIVIIQPNGKVLQNSSWDAGAFETTEGRKLYTTKVLFNAANETKRPSFSISADNLQRGTYLIQVYYNGSVIGRGSKTLL